MRFDVITLFPNMFQGVLQESILKRAQESDRVSICLHDMRQWSQNRHRKVDDKPYGGGPGMVICPEPLFGCIEYVRRESEAQTQSKPWVVYVSPQGKPFTQRVAQSLAQRPAVVLLCGHYEGIDQRAIEQLVDEEISLADVVLTGGEIPAMAILDAVVRLLPGVLGDESSADEDSFSGETLEYPQYTRPAVFRGMKVPGVLVSGDHKKVHQWRQRAARAKTLQRRPDLLIEPEER